MNAKTNHVCRSDPLRTLRPTLPLEQRGEAGGLRGTSGGGVRRQAAALLPGHRAGPPGPAPPHRGGENRDRPARLGSRCDVPNINCDQLKLVAA